jgi:DNA polymerase-1
MVNLDGNHVGGLGGFFRSLGALVKTIEPTQIYIIFDGVGSSNNRKNILPEYKSGRNINRITNWEAFANSEEEDEAKIQQITRIIQYLSLLPVNTISIDKVEADDIISFLAHYLPKSPQDKSFIVSSDMDYLQLINTQIFVYRPIEKEYYTEDSVLSKFGVTSKNFLIYKTLLGDKSDGINGVKGLGPKKILKLFPELNQKEISLDNIFKICENKLKDNVIYARILKFETDLRRNHKIMDLHNPMIDPKDKKGLIDKVSSTNLRFYPKEFISLYEKDQLGGIIRNVNIWVEDIFGKFIKK